MKIHVAFVDYGVHDIHTCPLMLKFRHCGDIEKRILKLVESRTLNYDMA